MNMSLTSADLVAIKKIVDNRIGLQDESIATAFGITYRHIDGIDIRIDGLETDIKDLKEDVTYLRFDVGELQQAVGRVETNLHDVETNLQEHISNTSHKKRGKLKA